MTDITAPGQGGVYVMREVKLKEHVLDAARRNGWIVYHVPQARIPNAGTKGYPDLTLARDEEVIWIELKQESAGLSPFQKIWHAALGSRVHVVRPSDLYNGRVAELLA